MEVAFNRLTKSARFWALALGAALLVALAPSTARAQYCGICGSQACMTPTGGGCIGQYQSICYGGTIYTCYFDPWSECSQLYYTGQCNPH